MKSRISKPMLPLVPLAKSKGDKVEKASIPTASIEMLQENPPPNTSHYILSTGNLPSAIDTLTDDSSSTDEDEAVLITVDVSLIDPNPFPPRHIYTEEMIENMSLSLSESGQAQPIIICVNPDNPQRFIIGEGWTRVQAVRNHNILDGKLTALLYKNLTPVQVSRRGWTANNERNAPTDLDKYYYISQFPEQLSGSIRNASSFFGLPKSSLERILCFGKLTQALLDLCKTNPTKLSGSVAQVLSRINNSHGEPVALEIANKFIKKGESFRWLVSQESKLTRSNPINDNAADTSTRSLRKVVLGNCNYKLMSSGDLVLKAKFRDDLIEAANKILEKAMQDIAELGAFNDKDLPPS